MRLFYQNFPIRQTLSDESIKEQKPEAMSGKSAIQQILSVKSQKQQMLPPVSTAQEGQFEPILSWSHHRELLKVEEHLAR